MRISELEDKQKEVNMDLKIIYDEFEENNKWGKRVKTVAVVDADLEKGGETALLDLFNDDVDNYKQFDKLRVVNGSAKKITTKRGDQMLISPWFLNGKFMGRYEKIGK